MAYLPRLTSVAEVMATRLMRPAFVSHDLISYGFRSSAFVSSGAGAPCPFPRPVRRGARAGGGAEPPLLGGGHRLHSAGGQRFAADRPLAVLDLLHAHPGDRAHVF